MSEKLFFSSMIISSKFFVYFRFTESCSNLLVGGQTLCEINGTTNTLNYTNLNERHPSEGRVKTRKQRAFGQTYARSVPTFV